MKNVESSAAAARARPDALASVVMLVNTACAGLSGLYLTTRSVVVTVIGAVLAVVLTLMVMPAIRPRR